MLSLGMDIGTSTIKLVLLKNQEIETQWMAVHHGNPFVCLKKGLSTLELAMDTPFSLCVTGSNTEALLEQDSAIPSLGDIPAIVEGVRWIIPQVGSVIEIGSQGARFITDLQSRAPQFAVNEHCAGGTGSFFEDQMSRVGCKLEDYSSLVKQAQRGDADAFVALIEKYKMDLYKVAKACLKNEEDVADVMQETTLSAWEHIGELKKAAYFKTWLTRILINNCNNVLRERKRCIATEDFSMQGEEPQAKTDAEFYEMLSCLPEKYKHIFLLYYGQGFRTREIAEILDLSENTVKSRLRRGRESLKSQLIL